MCTFIRGCNSSHIFKFFFLVLWAFAWKWPLSMINDVASHTPWSWYWRAALVCSDRTFFTFCDSYKLQRFRSPRRCIRKCSFFKVRLLELIVNWLEKKTMDVKLKLSVYVHLLNESWKLTLHFACISCRFCWTMFLCCCPSRNMKNT